jgi:hypothetical protein
MPILYGDRLTYHLAKCPFKSVREVKASMLAADAEERFLLPDNTIDVVTPIYYSPIGKPKPPQKPTQIEGFSLR